ncbi:MAG: hypothetical protein K2G10_05280, partial [Alistipes sp.]|nr:hypothetical protein [Alistipes sp.]
MGFTLYLAARYCEDLERRIKVLSHVFYMPIPEQRNRRRDTAYRTKKMKRLAILFCTATLMSS